MVRDTSPLLRHQSASVKLKLVFIITGLSTGGAEMMLFKVLKFLDRQRFEPYVISLTSEGELAPQISELGISVHCLQTKSGLTVVRAFFRLIRLVKSIQPDIVHTWMYHADLMGGLAAKFAGVKAIAWCIRNSNLEPKLTKLSTRMIVRLCALLSHWVPALILSCSEQARLIHVRCGYRAEKMLVVPNGFDLIKYKPDGAAKISVCDELGLAHDCLLIGNIGRFDPQKNHAGFFSVIEFLHQKMPQLHFLCVGKDIDSVNPVLAMAAKDADVVENCHFLGLRNDIPRIMAALDVLVSSASYGEAFPNVLGEAMACGVPCAVTEVGDSAYIVADTGRSVAVGDMRGLAVAVHELLTLSTEEIRVLGEKARARVAEHFEIRHIVREYENFYLRLLESV